MSKIKNRKGYTLVEVLIALIIISLLAGALVLIFGKIERKSKLTVDIANVRTAKSAAVMKYADSAGGRKAVYIYDGEKVLDVTDGEIPPDTKGYGKSAFGVWKEEYGAEGHPVSENGTANYIIAFLDNGKMKLRWSEAGMSLNETITSKNNCIEWNNSGNLRCGDIVHFYGGVPKEDRYYVVAEDGVWAQPNLSSNYIRVDENKDFVTKKDMGALSRGDIYRDSLTGEMYCWIGSLADNIFGTETTYTGSLPPATEKEMSHWIKITKK